MIVKSVHVRNFRSIADERIDLDDLIVLVGRNGTGKSSFLMALELFYDPKTTTVAIDDFYDEETGADIEIAVTFGNLDTEESKLFGPYLDGDDLTVARVFSASDRKSGTYHGMRLQNPDFAEARSAGGKTDFRTKYSELRQSSVYSSLPSVRNAEQAEEELKKWEADNPASCRRLRDDGQFFGFTQVAQGYLGRHTQFIRVPAVRDAADDATEGKGSSVTQIMDLVVRGALANRTELLQLRDETRTKYRAIMDPATLTELSALQVQLSDTLKNFAPEASVSLEWAEIAEVDLPLPKAEVKLNEDGHKSSVERTGHGLQRAFILTMLQHLVAAKGKEGPAEMQVGGDGEVLTRQEAQLPSLLLAIEEPELYQHPSRQRHMATVLRRLADGVTPGVAKRTQVLYATHSPLFVNLDRFEQIRLLRKIDGDAGRPRVTKSFSAKLDDVAQELWVAGGSQGAKYTGETLRPRLRAVMTPWVNEGFFADVAVLVEGEDDRAAILGVAQSMGHDLDRLGVAVIPCGGKPNLDRPLAIFRRLGIPVYVVWDSDEGQPGASPGENRRLLRIMGQPEEDWPAGVHDAYACFEIRLENTLGQEIGTDTFERLLSNAQSQLGIPKRAQALKNPVVLARVVDEASKEGRTSETLRGIVEMITDLGVQRVSGR